jgi:probable HAF family extracellular repeat protein
LRTRPNALTPLRTTRVGRRRLAAIAAGILVALAVATSAPAGAAEEPAEPLEAFSQSTMLGLGLGSSAASGGEASAGTEAASGPSAPIQLAFVLQGERFRSIEFPGNAYLADINNHGRIAGNFYDAAGGLHGVARDKRGRLTRIDVPRAAGTVVLDLDERGRTVGTYSDTNPSVGPADDKRGFLRTGSGRFTTIHVPGSAQSQAFGVNDRGHVVGEYYEADGTVHGYRWEQGRFTTIDGPDGAVGASVTDINDAGEMVGVYGDAAGGLHAFLLSDGVYTTIDAPGVPLTLPYDINNRGRSSASRPSPR